MYNETVKNFLHTFFVFVLLFGLGGVNYGTAQAQQGTGSQYFADTGHHVSGEFLYYYQSVPNANVIFGYPITEQFTDEVSGRLIQYFERVRFEYQPERAAGQRVQLSPLGDYVQQRAGTSASLDVYTPVGCRFYAASGYSVCYAFLEYFDKNGGEAIFGMPKSSFVFYNGRIVQYFERARMEWYPEYPEGQRVVLAELGKIYFDLVPEDPTLLQAVKPDNYQGGVLSINARVFTWKAVTQLNDEQTVYVVVQDQTLSPVQGATVIVTVEWVNGGSQSIAQSTNAFGVVTVPLLVQSQPHGSLINVRVEVLYSGGLSSTALTSFRVWQ